MSPADFDTFLLIAATMAGCIAALNLFMMRKRGTRSLYLAGTAASVTAGIVAYRYGLPTPVLIAFGGLAFLLVLGDAWARFQQGGNRR